MTAIRLAVLSEGLCGDLRPLCYGRSTWDMPFLGRPLLDMTLAWLEREAIRHVLVLDDTPGLWLLDLCRRVASRRLTLELVDARVDDSTPSLAGREERALLIKPSALVAPDVSRLERFHDETAASATFALVRLDPGSLPWSHIPACRMDVTGRILEVEKLRRTDTLGSASLENILGTGAPSRAREFWAPRNVAILEPDVMARLPPSELTAPLAGLARSLAQEGTVCYGRALKGHWWAASTAQELLRANRDALIFLRTTTPTAPTAHRRGYDLQDPPRLTEQEDSSNPPAGEAAVIDSSATVEEGVYLAEHARVARGATVQGRTIIGRHSHVGEGTHVISAVVEPHCLLEAGSHVEQALVGWGTRLPPGLHLKNGVVGSGEVQNLARGVPPGGFYVDGLHSVDETTVEGYWSQCPVPERSPRYTTLRTLARGIENNVYAVGDGDRTLVLKRRLDCNAHPLIREYHVLRSLESEGLAPRVFALDLRPEVTFSPCIIMEHVRGSRIKSGQIDADLAARIGRTCARVHSLPVTLLLRELPELADASYPDLASYAYYIIEQYQAWQIERSNHGIHDDRLDALLARLLDWVQKTGEQENAHWEGPIPRSLCQGDLREFNMIVRDDDLASPYHHQVALLDWERCGIDDPAYDLGWFLALARLAPAAEEALRRGYGEGHPGDNTFWLRVEAFRTLDVVAWPISLIQMVQAWRDARTGRDDGVELARAYEQEACEALADAFTLMSKRDPDPSCTHLAEAGSAEALRKTGRLLAVHD